MKKAKIPICAHLNHSPTITPKCRISLLTLMNLYLSAGILSENYEVSIMFCAHINQNIM